MPVKIFISPNQVAANVKGAWDRSLYALSAQILQDCNEFVKYDQGTLQSSSYVASRLRDGKLVWDTVYAKRQYWEIKTSLTPGRTWKWCETAKKKHLSQWKDQAEKGLRDNL